MPKRKPDPMLFAEMEEELPEDDPHKLMFKAIGEACGYDLPRTPRSACKLIGEVAVRLAEIGATPEEVRPTMEKLIATKNGDEKFRTPKSLENHWSKVRLLIERPPKYRTGSPAEPDDDYDEHRENIKRVERSERVAELDEAVRNQLAERLRKSIEGSPILLNAWEHRGPWFNTEICKLLDEMP